MDGYPRRQTKRDELYRVGKKVPDRSTDGKEVCGIAAETKVHSDGAVTDKAGWV